MVADAGDDHGVGCASEHATEVRGWTATQHGASEPWPGINHFPGDRESDGSIPVPGTPWTTPGADVWQGLPAHGVVSRAELGVFVTDVCVESCEGDADVTVEVFNSGQVDVSAGTTLVVEALDSGESLGSASVPELPSGVATFLGFTVPAAKVQGGVEARISVPDGVEECGNVPDVDSWRDVSCP